MFLTCIQIRIPNIFFFFFLFKEGDLKSSNQPKLVSGKDEFTVSLTTTQPVTYSWENIEVYLETTQGNIFKRMPSVQKRILDNGKSHFP